MDCAGDWGQNGGGGHYGQMVARWCSTALTSWAPGGHSKRPTMGTVGATSACERSRPSCQHSHLSILYPDCTRFIHLPFFGRQETLQKQACRIERGGIRTLTLNPSRATLLAWSVSCLLLCLITKDQCLPVHPPSFTLLAISHRFARGGSHPSPLSHITGPRTPPQDGVVFPPRRELLLSPHTPRATYLPTP